MTAAPRLALAAAAVARRPRPPPPHFRRGCERGGAQAGGRPAAGGGGIGWARPVVRVVLSRFLRCPRALRAAGAMGNCHTVGPNEALVVSGERAAREVGLGRRGWEGVGARWLCPRRWLRRGLGVGVGLGSERGRARPEGLGGWRAGRRLRGGGWGWGR